MTPKKIAIRGLTSAFAGKAELDLEKHAHDGGLIALVGDNGAGKTTLLEALGPAALYRFWPSYGAPFHGQAVSDRASVDLRFDLQGSEYRAVVSWSAGKTEATLYKDGSVVAGPLVRDFDSAISSILPSKELFLACAFAAQGGSGSLLSLPVRERKALFVSMLGLSRLDELAAKARELGRGHKATASSMAQAAQLAEDAASEIVGLEEQIAHLELERCRLVDEIERAKGSLSEAQEELEKALQAEASQVTQRLRRRLDELNSELGQDSAGDIRCQLAKVEADLERYRAEQTELHAIRHGAEQAEKAKQSAAALEAQAKKAEGTISRLELERARSKAAALKPLLAYINLDNPMCSVCPLVTSAQEGGRDADEIDREISSAKVVIDRYRSALQMAERLSVSVPDDLERRIEEVRVGAFSAEKNRERLARLLALAEERDRLAEQLKDLPEPVAETSPDTAAARAHVSEAKSRLQALEDELSRISSAVAQTTGRIEAIQKRAADAEKLSEEAKKHSLSATACDALAFGLGPDGVQALEISEAGPQVSALANDLLDACYGGRFQVAIETLAPKKSGGYKETFQIRILDGESGRSVSRGSGGEMVVIDEAIRLALAIFNTHRSGFEIRTLYRDETTGALSPKNADRYVTMMRRAMEIGGFRQVIFVAHQEHVWRQADAVVSLPLPNR